MANSSDPLTGSDLGPVFDGSGSTTRKVQPDNTNPVDPEENSAPPEETDTTAERASVKVNGAVEQNVSKAGAGVADQKESAAAEAPASGNAPPPPQQSEDQGKRRTAPGTVGFWPEIDCSKSYQEVESALYECMKTKYGFTLVTDMDDAEQLLSYVTRNGLQDDRKVSDDAVKTIISSRERMRAGDFDCAADEPNFRKSYGALAKAAEPVTVASLRDSLTTGSYGKWTWRPPFSFNRIFESRPIADVACLRYRKYALVVLFSLLAVQIYWTAVSSVLSKTDVLISELNKAPTKQYYLQEAARQAALKAATQPSSPAPGTSPGTSQANAPASTPQPSPTEVNVDKSQLTLDELVSKKAELDANYSMLEKFVRWWPLSNLDFIRETPASSSAVKEQGAPPPNPEAIFVPSKPQDRIASSRAVAGQVIDVIQKWVLPLLYGALGAMVFVVRTLSVQARDRLFRREALVSLVLRVFLGMISGLAIGWFWNQNPAGATAAGALTASTLSPFALAFVAGYGVELFFALLDKIVSTFTNKT